MSPVTVNLSRRGFLKAGSGLVLGLHLSGFGPIPELDEFISTGALKSEGVATSLNAWLRITEQGVATLRVGAVEMGQGVFTSLPMLLAEELDLPFDSVRVEACPVDRAYYRPSTTFPTKVLMTGGSESIRGHWDLLREAGAEARAVLLQAAATRWGVSRGQCKSEAGFVVCGERRASYGELAVEASQFRPPSRVALKTKEECTLLGTSPPRIDLPDKVSGKTIFGIDVQIDGQVNATLRACPHHGGTLVSFDDSKARAIPGVIDVFVIGEAIAVVADSFWHAKKAAGLLEVIWDAGQGAGLDDEVIRTRLTSQLDAARIVHKKGGLPKALEISAEYYSPFLDHAPIEPLNATAYVQEDRVDVWAPTQVQHNVKKQASRLTGVPAHQCFVHATYLGGGFGRKSLLDFTEAAIRIAMKVVTPVKMIWTREESFSHGQYRPATASRLAATLGADGFPTDYEARITSQNVLDGRMPSFLLDLVPAIGETVHGGLDTPYAIDRQVVRHKRVKLPIPVGWWRSVQGSHNGFYRESFIDELAHAAEQDPIAYRRHLLRNSPRHLACFELAVEKSPKLPKGQHRGVAIFKSFGSIVATVLDLSVADNWLKVHQITTAVDCGRIVHPDTIHAQMMSASLMGLSAALYGKMSFVDGAAQQQNFHQYKLLSMSEAPPVHSYIVDSNEEPGGVGEVALPPLAGALGNALFAATGIRARQLPLSDVMGS